MLISHIFKRTTLTSLVVRDKKFKLCRFKMSEFSALPERGTSSSSPEVIPDTEFDTDEVHAAENLITRLEADIKIINAKLKKM